MCEEKNSDIIVCLQLSSASKNVEKFCYAKGVLSKVHWCSQSSCTVETYKTKV